MENEKIKFAQALYDAILKSGYSYEDVASMIDLKSSREIYNYIDGIKWPSTIRMLKLIQLFKLDIDSILSK